MRREQCSVKKQKKNIKCKKLCARRKFRKLMQNEILWYIVYKF